MYKHFVFYLLCSCNLIWVRLSLPSLSHLNLTQITLHIVHCKIYWKYCNCSSWPSRSSIQSSQRWRLKIEALRAAGSSLSLHSLDILLTQIQGLANTLICVYVANCEDSLLGEEDKNDRCLVHTSGHSSSGNGGRCLHQYVSRLLLAAQKFVYEQRGPLYQKMSLSQIPLILAIRRTTRGRLDVERVRVFAYKYPSFLHSIWGH